MVNVAQIFAQTAAPDLSGVRHAFSRYLYLPDTGVVDIVMGAYVGNQMRGDPVWLQVVGAPSRGKTEVVSSLADMPDVHMLSTLTAQTFASGVKKDRNASLLYRLEDKGKRILVLKDLTTVLTLHRDARDAVFAALREIFDGQFRKEFGSGETVAWEGKLGVIAGVTPVIDRHHAAIAQLGDRFVNLRLPEVDRDTVSRRSMDAMGSEKEERLEIRRVVRAFLEAVDVTDRLPSEGVKDAIRPIADLVTHARTGVYRDGYSREIDDLPELESPARLAKQLCALEVALEVLGHDEDSALALVRRVGADSVPPGRMRMLRLLTDAQTGQTTADLASLANMPTVTARRVLEDLAALRLVTRTPRGKGSSDVWDVSDGSLPKWLGAGL